MRHPSHKLIRDEKQNTNEIKLQPQTFVNFAHVYCFFVNDMGDKLLLNFGAEFRR